MEARTETPETMALVDALNALLDADDAAVEAEEAGQDKEVVEQGNVQVRERVAAAHRAGATWPLLGRLLGRDPETLRRQVQKRERAPDA